MNISDFIRKIPKISLHLHLEGAVRPDTFVELAARHHIELPPYDEPSDLYRHDNVAVFFQTFAKVRRSMQDVEDYRRVTYEVLQDEAAYGVRYIEFFASTTGHLEDGVSFDVQMEGMRRGIRDAEADFKIQARIIPSLHRTCSAGLAEEMVEAMMANRCDEIIGLGMGGDEEKFPPEKFERAYRLAGKAGFRRTAHVCERVSSTQEITTCLDLLGCDRLDHGYRIVFDDALAQRCASQGIVFTTIPLAQYHLQRWYPDLGDELIINRMIRKGLRVMLDTDDPAIGGITAANPFEMALEQMHCSPQDLKTFVMNSIDGSWLDDVTKREWRSAWGAEIDQDLSCLDI